MDDNVRIFLFIVLIALLLVIAYRDLIAAPLVAESESILIWRMPAGARRVVVCEGARLAVHPVNPTHVLLWCMADDSPLPTPLPPRP